MSKLEQARKTLATAVEASGGVTAAAFQLGVSAATVSYVIDGHRNVGLELAYRIRELYGIPMEDWREEQPEVQTVKRFAK